MMRKLILFVVLMMLGIVSVPPALADGGAYWSGEYFNNPNFTPPAAMTRTDTTIAFNWGAHSPGLGMSADNFSVHWVSNVFLSQATYRFWALADDYVRVRVDNQTIIDTFTGGIAGQTVSGDVSLGFGIHEIDVAYRELSGNAYAYLAWADLATNPTGPNFPGTVAQPPGNTNINQWMVQYYNNVGLLGDPVVIQSDFSPTHDWGYSAPTFSVMPDNWSARWTGQQNLTGGQYRITVSVDDGVRVYIDGVLVMNEWHGATNQIYSVDLNLLGTQHSIVVEYYDATAEAHLNFSIAPLVNGVPGTSNPTTPPINGWLAYYFNNPSLTDTPAAIQTETSPNHNWGTGSPLPNVSADHFSARWTSIPTLAAGNYRISVTVDDGVRVYVDGVVVINEWHGADSLSYTYDVRLIAGPHTFTIEYYEDTGIALVNFALGPATQATPAPTALPNGVEQPRDTGAQATVGLYRVNVRSQPNTEGSVTAKINPGETYTIMGRNETSSWWQISVNGVLGWVFGNYVNTYNTANVPITYRANVPPVANTGYTVQATTNVIIRSGPGTSNALLGNLPSGATAAVVGRNASTTWYQINYRGVIGWVIAGAVHLQGSAQTSPIPITG